MASLHRVLVVGVGSIGERHLRCFQNSGRCSLAICEPHAALRQDVAGRYGVAADAAFADVETALATAEFDAAVVATPAPLHIPLSTQLAQAGKHLLIEKPLSTSIDGVAELEQLITSKSLKAAVGYTHRAHPANAAVKAAIDAGRFGSPRELTLVTGQNFPHYRPAYRDIYYADRAAGGGAIQDALTHMLNLGEWLLGPIERLVCDAEHMALEGVDVEDTVHLLARHGSTMASYALNQYQFPNECACTIVCESATVRIDYSRKRWSYVEQIEGPWIHHEVDLADRDALYERQAHAFLDAVEGNLPPLCSLAEGWQTLRVNLAALKSLCERGWVTL